MTKHNLTPHQSIARNCYARHRFLVDHIHLFENLLCFFKADALFRLTARLLFGPSIGHRRCSFELCASARCMP